MPALEEKVIKDIQTRLENHLKAKEGYGEPQYITSGGSAAVFRVETPNGARAFKGYNPAYFAGDLLPVTRKRLEIQRSTIGHSCQFLIQTYGVDESEGIAFVEMEFLEWPALNACISQIPDEAIVPLLTQLVEAIRYLENLNIVHRDIKPENIHVSHDFNRLVLLDLGVARHLNAEDAADAALTDQGNSRPFLATAQYSSPEYLFRLDEPSPKLWRALNFYQIGAVLHDLIMKRQLFDHEMKLNNRWLVAKAVLTKTPSFHDPAPGRLLGLKSLASRCLVKDIESRLNLVGWDDFQLAEASDPLTALAGRLAKRTHSFGAQSGQTAAVRLDFERKEYSKRLLDTVRNELIHICGTDLPFTVEISEPQQSQTAKFSFAANDTQEIDCLVKIQWLTELHERTANISLQCRIRYEGRGPGFEECSEKPVQHVAISDGDPELATALAANIAKVVHQTLDIVDSAVDAPSKDGQSVTFE